MYTPVLIRCRHTVERKERDRRRYNITMSHVHYIRLCLCLSFGAHSVILKVV